MASDPRVRWIGAQREVLRGAIDGRVILSDLRALPHLYALGPVAGVRGEVSVFDGTPSIARVVDGRIAVESTFDVGACFLVYADVPSWHETPMATPRATRSACSRSSARSRREGSA
jgi:acetolactate decarboxylase